MSSEAARKAWVTRKANAGGKARSSLAASLKQSHKRAVARRADGTPKNRARSAFARRFGANPRSGNFKGLSKLGKTVGKMSGAPKGLSLTGLSMYRS